MKENLILSWWVQVEETTHRTAIPSSSNPCKIHLKQFLIRTCVMSRCSSHLVNWDSLSRWSCLRRLWKLINMIKSSCIKKIDQAIQTKYTSKSHLKNRINSSRTPLRSLKSCIIPQASKFRESIPHLMSATPPTTCKPWITLTWKCPRPLLPIWEPSIRFAINTRMKMQSHNCNSLSSERIRQLIIRAWEETIRFRAWPHRHLAGCVSSIRPGCRLTRGRTRIWCLSH